MLELDYEAAKQWCDSHAEVIAEFDSRFLIEVKNAIQCQVPKEATQEGHPR